MTPSKPTLIYDGDCGFCRRWIERWRQSTGETVEYRPYQEAASSFPQISETEFRTSVRLIQPDGRVYQGAEAVFRSLALAGSKGHWLWLYEHSIFFRQISEFFYAWVATHRVGFSILSRLLWGDDARRSTYVLADSFFPRLMGLVYFIAFGSLGTQILGLSGANGIYPAREYLQAVREQVANAAFRMPTLAWLNSSDVFLSFLCWGGAAFGMLVMLGVAPVFFLFLSWVFYLSLFTVGGPFLSFQWDILLLETGFLAIFFTPVCLRLGIFTCIPSPAIFRLLLKFLLFKLMFFSGFVKLASGDPAWRNLTALQYHFQTQPLPPWTAWYTHHLPAWFLKGACFLSLAVELVLPFFIFLPRRPRHFAAALLIFFQVLIAFTGNYTFFNLLTCVLCLMLVDDSAWPRKISSQIGQWASRQTKGRFFPRAILYAGAVLIFMANLGSARWLEGLHLAGNYGLFAVMTTQRPEIILEGSNDGTQWLPYEFKYKPGDVTRSPGWVAPHQPRLDWQMWFAALGTWQQNRWFILFCSRIFENSEDVAGLVKKNPFPDAPPKYLRATVYNYRFTTPEERKETGAWWHRELKGLYCPVMTKSKSTTNGR